jgi:hypothetical protein
VDVIVERCAGLDVHTKTVMAAVRTPGAVSRRRQVVRESTYNEGWSPCVPGSWPKAPPEW